MCSGSGRIHPLLDQRADVFAGDVGDGLEEGVGGQQHLAPHVALVLLRGRRAGQAQQLVEDLQEDREAD